VSRGCSIRAVAREQTVTPVDLNVMAGWKDCIALRAGTPENGTVRGPIRFSAFTTINEEQNFPPDFGRHDLEIDPVWRQPAPARALS
jgi:hypothetical protein